MSQPTGWSKAVKTAPTNQSPTRSPRQEDQPPTPLTNILGRGRPISSSTTRPQLRGSTPPDTQRSPEEPAVPTVAPETPLNRLMDDLETLEKYLEPDVDISVVIGDEKTKIIETHPSPPEPVTMPEQKITFSELKDQVDELEKLAIASTRDEKKRLQHQPGMKNIAVTMNPASLDEMVSELERLLKYHSEGTETPTKRILNLLYCTLAGGNTLPEGPHPEARVCAAILTGLPASERLNYFTRLFNEFQDRLTPAQRKTLTDDLRNIEFASRSPTHSDSLASYARMVLGNDITSFLRELT